MERDQLKALFASFAPDSSKTEREVDSELRQLVSTLKEENKNVEILVSQAPLDALQLAHEATNSIAQLAILDILHKQLESQPESAAATSDRRAILDDTLNFVLNFDPVQIRYAGSIFLALMERLGKCSLFTPLVSVELLATALLRLDPTASTFTSSHLLLATLAYESNCIEPALKVIDRDITAYPYTPSKKENKILCDTTLPPAVYLSTSTGLTREIKSTSILEYNLVCGLVCMSRREWEKARRAFERVVTHPTKDRGVSKIMVESYKKWLLVGLLSEGRELTLPSYTSPATKSTCSGIAEPYHDLVKFFIEKDTAKLRAEYAENRTTWQTDGNESLVQEVLKSYQKWQIINLRRIYSHVSVSKIQRSTTSAETGEHIKNKADIVSLLRDMIESNMLKGELHTDENGDDYLTFHADRELLSEQTFAHEIASAHRAITEMSQEYQAAGERLGAHKEYVKYLVREQKRNEKEAEHPSGNFESQIEDEDLMTGIIAHG